MDTLDKISKVIDLAIKADAHAFLLILLGAILHSHQPNIGDGLVMAGLGIFKTGR